MGKKEGVVFFFFRFKEHTLSLINYPSTNKFYKKTSLNFFLEQKNYNFDL